VTVDGVSRGRLDASASHPAGGVELFDTGALAPGAHTLVARLQGAGDALSSGTAVALASVQVVGGASR
jgi:hypothetical protein